MKKNRAGNVVIHDAENLGSAVLSEKISAFFRDAIERRLNQSELSAGSKIELIDRILNSAQQEKSQDRQHDECEKVKASP